eukprot:TRINITY_DN14843_c0_g1_i1.p1 TRINITY_DN14843_c0_g1~~TRINITY_DN14843_c0_g1_i1.p1  ORF type:complete len:281 (+),score=66.94 TRINITY_DN14843_c0_g1_i1:47-889(+)
MDASECNASKTADGAVDTETLCEDDALDTHLYEAQQRCIALEAEYLQLLSAAGSKTAFGDIESVYREKLITRTKRIMVEREIERIEADMKKTIHPENEQSLWHIFKNQLSLMNKELGEAIQCLSSEQTKACELLQRLELANNHHTAIQNELKQQIAGKHATSLDERITAEFQSLQEKHRQWSEVNQLHFQELKSFLVRNFPTIRPIPGTHENPSHNRLIYDIKPLLQELMNRALMEPHDPYVKLDPLKHWTPYVDSLIAAGVAEPHKQKSGYIKLAEFHV